MKFKHRFRVRASLSMVTDFHRQASSMIAITPPIIPLRMEKMPQRLSSGDEMAFTMWLGLIPVRWRALISQVSHDGFSDHQLEGPFRHWEHRHTFTQLDSQTTDVVDEIHARLRWHPLWGPVGLALWLGLPILFAYRGWKTRRLLEGQGA